MHIIMAKPLFHVHFIYIIIKITSDNDMGVAEARTSVQAPARPAGDQALAAFNAPQKQCSSDASEWRLGTQGLITPLAVLPLVSWTPRHLAQKWASRYWDR